MTCRHLGLHGRRHGRWYFLYFMHVLVFWFAEIHQIKLISLVIQLLLRKITMIICCLQLNSHILFSYDILWVLTMLVEDISICSFLGQVNSVAGRSWFVPHVFIIFSLLQIHFIVAGWSWFSPLSTYRGRNFKRTSMFSMFA